MPDSKRDFVFLLRFNISDLKEINTKLDTDCDHWAGAKCTFTPVTGEYDMVVHAAGGTLQEALNYAAYSDEDRTVEDDHTHGILARRILGGRGSGAAGPQPTVTTVLARLPLLWLKKLRNKDTRSA